MNRKHWKCNIQIRQKRHKVCVCTVLGEALHWLHSPSFLTSLYDESITIQKSRNSSCKSNINCKIHNELTKNYVWRNGVSTRIMLRYNNGTRNIITCLFAGPDLKYIQQEEEEGFHNWWWKLTHSPNLLHYRLLLSCKSCCFTNSIALKSKKKSQKLTIGKKKMEKWDVT